MTLYVYALCVSRLKWANLCNLEMDVHLTPAILNLLEVIVVFLIVVFTFTFTAVNQSRRNDPGGPKDSHLENSFFF